jgi:hypothetical protein
VSEPTECVCGHFSNRHDPHDFPYLCEWCDECPGFLDVVGLEQQIDRDLERTA